MEQNIEEESKKEAEAKAATGDSRKSSTNMNPKPAKANDEPKKIGVASTSGEKSAPRSVKNSGASGKGEGGGASTSGTALRYRSRGGRSGPDSGKTAPQRGRPKDSAPGPNDEMTVNRTNPVERRNSYDGGARAGGGNKFRGYRGYRGRGYQRPYTAPRYMNNHITYNYYGSQPPPPPHD